jgi:predicted PurR-regulated permease PerM
MIYVVIFVLLLSFVYWAFPILAGQLQSLASMSPEYLNRIVADISIFHQKLGTDYAQKLLGNLSALLSGATEDIFGTAANIFGGFFSSIVIVVISFYLVVQDKGIKLFLSSVTPAEHRAYVINLAERIQTKLGRWLRGQLIVMMAVGVLVFTGLYFLGVKMALMVAVLAGLFELIPYIGPFTAGAIAVSLSFLQSPILGILVLVLFLIIHQIEGYVLIPQVMKRAVGLNPLVVIISMIIGAKLYGIFGMAVAVPIVAIASVFLGDIFMREEAR